MFDQLRVICAKCLWSKSSSVSLKIFRTDLRLKKFHLSLSVLFATGGLTLCIVLIIKCWCFDFLVENKFLDWSCLKRIAYTPWIYQGGGGFTLEIHRVFIANFKLLAANKILEFCQNEQILGFLNNQSDFWIFSKCCQDYSLKGLTKTVSFGECRLFKPGKLVDTIEPQESALGCLTAPFNWKVEFWILPKNVQVHLWPMKPYWGGLHMCTVVHGWGGVTSACASSWLTDCDDVILFQPKLDHFLSSRGPTTTSIIIIQPQ
jgi:hypothetical protein